MGRNCTGAKGAPRPSEGGCYKTKTTKCQEAGGQSPALCSERRFEPRGSTLTVRVTPSPTSLRQGKGSKDNCRLVGGGGLRLRRWAISFLLLVEDPAGRGGALARRQSSLSGGRREAVSLRPGLKFGTMLMVEFGNRWAHALFRPPARTVDAGENWRGDVSSLMRQDSNLAVCVRLPAEFLLV